MTTLEYRNVLAENMIKTFVADFKEKTGLKISINIHNDSILQHSHIDSSQDLPVISLNELESVVLSIIPYKIDSSELKSKCRKREYVDVRSIFSHIARRLKFKYEAIGSYIKRDHTSVIHLERKAYDLMETDPIFLTIYTKIIEKLKEKYDKII